MILSRISFFDVSEDSFFSGSEFGIKLDEFNPRSFLKPRVGISSFNSSFSRNQIFGGRSNDILVSRATSATFNGGKGSDILTSISGNNSFSGGEDDDILLGGIGNDTLDGGEGNDIIAGISGDDSISGGLGDDTLTGGSIFVSKEGNSTTIFVSDTSGIDTLSGGEGADRLLLGGKSQFVGETTVIQYDEAGNDDYALITDFDTTEDVIQLGGSQSDYRLDSSPIGLPSGTGIFLGNELTAIVQGSSELDLSASYFEGSEG
ncbi:calcium-binding protein [Moorena producens]|uniref:calcium-binding protein n=1 Tax=Moorena producens TaxID=1155739 RepID=UPI003C72E858